MIFEKLDFITNNQIHQARQKRTILTNFLQPYSFGKHDLFVRSNIRPSQGDEMQSNSIKIPYSVHHRIQRVYLESNELRLKYQTKDTNLDQLRYKRAYTPNESSPTTSNNQRLIRFGSRCLSGCNKQSSRKVVRRSLKEIKTDEVAGWENE